jgi:rubrerythrin
VTTIWAAAKVMEVQDRHLYERMARNALRQDLAALYTALARDERRHWASLDNLAKNMPLELFASANVKPDVGELFEKLSVALGEDGETLRSMHDAVYDFARALTLEQRSIEYYEGLRKTVEPGLQGVVIDQIISEERRHERILEGLLEFARQPSELVEASGRPNFISTYVPLI